VGRIVAGRHIPGAAHLVGEPQAIYVPVIRGHGTDVTEAFHAFVVGLHHLSEHGRPVAIRIEIVAFRV